MIKKRIFPETNLAFQCVTEGCSNDQHRGEDEVRQNATPAEANVSQSTSGKARVPTPATYRSNCHLDNFGVYSVKALAHLLTSRLTGFPMTVGLFTQDKSKEYLWELAGDIRDISQLANQPAPLTLTPLLFIFPLGLSVVLTYLVTMVTTWQVGLSIGHVAMFLQVAVLAFIIVGARIFQHRLACRASITVAQFLYWLRLLLQVCFCHPVHAIPWCSYGFRAILIFLMSSFIMLRWKLNEGQADFSVRLVSSYISQTEANPRFRFRRLCCLPSFVVMLAFLVALVVNTTIVRFNMGRLTHALSEGGLLFVFASMCFVLFLSLFGSLPSLWRLCRQGLMVSPAGQLRDALLELLSEDGASKDLLTLMVKKDKQSRLKNGISSRLCFKQTKEGSSVGLVKSNLVANTSTSLKNIAISLENEKIRQADALFKEEFAKIFRLSQSFDRFVRNRQIRFIICLDASETVHREVLARLIYQIHSLVLKDAAAQVAFVIEADFRVLLGEAAAAFLSLEGKDPSLGHVGTEAVANMLNNNLQLVQTRLHLPVFLERPLFPNLFSRRPSNLMANCCLPSAESPALISSCWRNRDHPSSCNSNIGIPIEMRPVPYPVNAVTARSPFDSQDIMISHFVRTGSNDVFRDLANLYTSNHLLADWNTKSLRQLVVATSFTIRLLVLLQSDVPLADVVLWICLVQYWSCHTAWLTIFLDENLANEGSQAKDGDQVDLAACMQEVKVRIASSIAMCVPLVSVDRDVQRLDALLSSRPQPMSLTNVSRLISCTLYHNPFLRYCIKAILQTQIPNQGGAPGVSYGFTSLGAIPTITGVNKKASVGKEPHNQPVGSSETLMSITVHPWSLDTSDERNMTKQVVNQRQQNHEPVVRLEKYTTADVCSLLSSIPDIPSQRTARYQTLFWENNINGLLLSVCDLQKLNRRLNVDTHDWWLISQVIHRLRERDAAKQKTVPPLDKGGVDLDETDSGSLPKPNGGVLYSQTYFQGLTRAPELMKRSTSSSIASICVANTTQSVMHVRQTPWLTSPQLPLSGQPIEKPLCPIPESTSPALQVNDGMEPENQTSLSGAEEPESLWKKAALIKGRSPNNVESYLPRPGDSVLQRTGNYHTETTPESDLRCNIMKWIEHTNEIGFRVPDNVEFKEQSHRRSVRSSGSRTGCGENKTKLKHLHKSGNSFGEVNTTLSPTILKSVSNVRNSSHHYGSQMRSRSSGPVVPNYHSHNIREHLHLTGGGNESLYWQPPRKHEAVKLRSIPISHQPDLNRTSGNNNTLRRWKKRVCRTPLDGLEMSSGHAVVNPSYAYALPLQKTNPFTDDPLIQQQKYNVAINPLTEPRSIMALRGKSATASNHLIQQDMSMMGQMNGRFVEPTFRNGDAQRVVGRPSGRSHDFCRPSQKKKPRRASVDISVSEISAPHKPFIGSVIQNPLCEKDDDEDILNANSIPFESDGDECDCNYLYAMGESAYNLTALSEPTLICSSIEVSSEDEKMAFSAGFEVEKS